MLKYLYNLITLLIIGGLTSCDIFDDTEYIPAYIEINEVILETKPGEGTSSHSISDCWIYVDNELLGVFETPLCIPSLKIGWQNIKIEPGIKNNGIDAERVIYPMMRSWTIDTSLNKKEIIELTPIFTYYDDVVQIIEDFDGAGIIFEVSDVSDTIIHLVSCEKAYEGKSMAIYLDDNNMNFECRSSDIYELPKNKPVYLEINYKNTDPFVFGIFARDYTGLDISERRMPVYVFNPTSKWRKTYIELNYHLNMAGQATEFRLFFTCSRTVSSPYSTTEVYIDNVKILY